jgi:DNA-binding response OmpR family regulator
MAAAVRYAPGSPGILVVDADPATRQLLRDVFARAGFESEAADDLDSALVRVAGARPAAVVLHDGIAGPQGVELLENLRGQHPELPVVFIANGGPDARAAAARFAATACLAKPFRMADLLAAVVRAVHFADPSPRARRRSPAGGIPPRASAAAGGSSARISRASGPPDSPARRDPAAMRDERAR